jgi:hypothetical protein
MADKPTATISEPAKNGGGLNGTDRPQDGLQNNSAEKIRQALGKRAANL